MVGLVPVGAREGHRSATHGDGCSPPGACRRRCRSRAPLGADLFLKPVTHSIKRIDHIETVVHRLKLLANALEVTIDSTVINEDIVRICRIHERAAASYNSRPTCQFLNDQELSDRERYRALDGVTAIP